LTPITEEEEFFPEGSPVKEFMDDLEYYFGTSVYVLDIKIYFGVQGVDKSDVGMWDASGVGLVEFDPLFTIYTEEA